MLKGYPLIEGVCEMDILHNIFAYVHSIWILIISLFGGGEELSQENVHIITYAIDYTDILLKQNLPSGISEECIDLLKVQSTFN